MSEKRYHLLVEPPAFEDFCTAPANGHLVVAVLNLLVQELRRHPWIRDANRSVDVIKLCHHGGCYPSIGIRLSDDDDYSRVFDYEREASAIVAELLRDRSVGDLLSSLRDSDFDCASEYDSLMR